MSEKEIVELPDSSTSASYENRIDGQKKKTRLSIFLVGGLLLVSVAALVGINLFYASDGNNLEAVVVDSNNEEHRFSLDEDASHTITTSLGYNTIEIKDGSVKVSHADCPNQTCVETGAVHEPGSIIVCLPHELIVTVEDTSGDAHEGKSDVDTISS